MSDAAKRDHHQPSHHVRLVTASSLFDGHDASINIMRRIMQTQGAEVIHLGHNRSVQEVVDAAIEEDVQGVAVSSYQGGHVEYFEYLVKLLEENGAGHIRVVGGGGGVIVPEEIARLRESGVTIFSPEDGQRLGLAGMINTVVADCDFDPWELGAPALEAVLAGERAAVARAITGAQEGDIDDAMLSGIREAAGRRRVPVLGITGTGWLRQVEPHRRADPPPAPRPAGQAARRRARRRPDAQPWRRCAARRPHPDELARRRPRLLPQPRDARRLPGADPPRRRPRRRPRCRLRPRHPRDAGHRSGRRGRHRLRRRLALRHDAGVRRQQPAREDRHARPRRRRRHQQVRAPRRRGRPARRRPPDGAQPRGLRQEPGRHARLRHLGGHLQRRRRHGALPGAARAALGAGDARRGGRAAARRHEAVHPHRDHRARVPGALPRRDQRHGPRLPRGHRAVCRRGRQGAAARVRAGRARGRSGGRRPRQRRERGRRRRGAARPGPHRRADRRGERAGRLALRRRVLLRRRAGRHDPGQGDPQHPDPGVAVGQQDPPRLTAPLPRPRRARQLPAPREPPRLLPLHGRRLPVQARGGGPGAHVRGGGRPVPHQPSLQARLRGAAGHPPVDGLRLRDALRPRPRPAPRRLRQGRHLGRLRRHARRHEGPLRRLRPRLADDERLHDDQRSGADDPRLLPQHRHRPAGRRLPGAGGQGAGRRRARGAHGIRPRQRPRHGAGRHPQGGPGPEHLHLQHRVQPQDDGRHPGVVHRAEGPQLLLRVDLRLPHRRGRGEPHQPARLHPRQRLHLRRELPRARHGGRRLRAQPRRSSSATAWTPSTPCSDVSPAASGPWR